ncbi:hypothetical protein [Deinococcus marmoris]|uniref:Uncharacterized protein n=1 Tax=Deinococcus marmoris TaxID=249408 RepID=A0A1U7P3F2_9DEIO|nr:hypothetical protein [Deinococcus marmoris]OLV19689.1 hypothetical protein BOO71_0002077 [Deinococcus marmoris]
MTGSKFAGLKAMRERRAQEVEETADQAGTPAAPEEPRRPVGRPPGKRSNPDYQQVTVLLHGQTYLEARKRLLDERKEVSELINELLDAWLKT